MKQIKIVEAVPLKDGDVLVISGISSQRDCEIFFEQLIRVFQERNLNIKVVFAPKAEVLRKGKSGLAGPWRPF